MQLQESCRDPPVCEVAVPPVDVVMPLHGLCRQKHLRPVWEEFGHDRPDKLPHEGIGKFGLRLSGASVDADKRFEAEQHEVGVGARTSAGEGVGLRD